jgi:hypothetical protein
MKLETAIKQINKEAAFIGWSGPAIIEDIAKHGRRPGTHRGRSSLSHNPAWNY